MSGEINKNYKYTPLTEPIPIIEHDWPEGTLPLVHTRTLTYMHKNFIRACIEGVLMQRTTFPVLILIHDDASTDGTAEIVAEYQNKYPKLIKTYFQKVNTFKKPESLEKRSEFNSWRTGKYEAICEGDDYWTDPLKLQKQVDFLEANKEYNACFTNADIIDELKGEIRTFVSVLKEGPVSFDKIVMYGGGLYPTASIMFKKSDYCDRDIILKSGLAGDTFLIFTLGVKGKVYFSNYKSCIYRRWSGGVSSRKLLNPETQSKRYFGEIKVYRNLDRMTNYTYSKSIKKRISLLYRKVFIFEPTVKNLKYFKFMIPKDILLSIRFCLGLFAKRIGVK